MLIYNVKFHQKKNEKSILLDLFMQSINEEIQMESLACRCQRKQSFYFTNRRIFEQESSEQNLSDCNMEGQTKKALRTILLMFVKFVIVNNSLLHLIK